MGFTSWPYAATSEAVTGTYTFIGAQADFLNEHLDEGVPWAEALANEPFPAWLAAKMEGRRQHRPAGVRLLLSLTPLNMGRDGLAAGLTAKGTQPPPAALGNKPFGNPAVHRAYLKYCRWAVAFFQPDYLLTGIEANEFLNHHPTDWKAYLAFSRQVQAELRRDHPRLPMAESVTLHKLLDKGNPGLEAYRTQIKAFVEGHDFFAVSFYPLFLGYHQPGEFSEALAFLPKFSSKPISIAETGHPAETIDLKGLKFRFATDPNEQAAYLSALLEQAQAQRYGFVVWWTARDFDQLWATFPKEVKDLGGLWRDTGLLTAAGQARPAYALWTNYLAKPRE